MKIIEYKQIALKEVKEWGGEKPVETGTCNHGSNEPGFRKETFDFQSSVIDYFFKGYRPDWESARYQNADHVIRQHFPIIKNGKKREIDLHVYSNHETSDPPSHLDSGLFKKPWAILVLTETTQTDDKPPLNAIALLHNSNLNSTYFFSFPDERFPQLAGFEMVYQRTSDQKPQIWTGTLLHVSLNSDHILIWKDQFVQVGRSYSRDMNPFPLRSATEYKHFPSINSTERWNGDFINSGYFAGTIHRSEGTDDLCWRKGDRPLVSISDKALNLPGFQNSYLLRDSGFLDWAQDWRSVRIDCFDDPLLGCQLVRKYRVMGHFCPDSSRFFFNTSTHLFFKNNEVFFGDSTIPYDGYCDSGNWPVFQLDYARLYATEWVHQTYGQMTIVGTPPYPLYDPYDKEGPISPYAKIHLHKWASFGPYATQGFSGRLGEEGFEKDVYAYQVRNLEHGFQVVYDRHPIRVDKDQGLLGCFAGERCYPLAIAGSFATQHDPLITKYLSWFYCLTLFLVSISVTGGVLFKLASEIRFKQKKNILDTLYESFNRATPMPPIPIHSRTCPKMRQSSLFVNKLINEIHKLSFNAWRRKAVSISLEEMRNMDTEKMDKRPLGERIVEVWRDVSGSSSGDATQFRIQQMIFSFFLRYPWENMPLEEINKMAIGHENSSYAHDLRSYANRAMRWDRNKLLCCIIAGIVNNPPNQQERDSKFIKLIENIARLETHRVSHGVSRIFSYL